MPRGISRFRRVIAALLALALLVLPGAPMRHASASPIHSMGQAASHDCVGHGAEAAPDQALASHHGDHGQTDRHSGKQQGLACCASAQCPATVAVPPMAPAQPAPMPRVRVTDFALLPAPDGVGVDPALHPPRTPA
jgi:hypothetical protein